MSDNLKKLHLSLRQFFVVTSSVLVLLLLLSSCIPGFRAVSKIPGYKEFQRGFKYYLALENKEAYEQFQSATDQGYAPAYYFLARMHHRPGEGIEKDYSRALSLYEQGLEAGDPKAHYGLGVMYRNGYGVEKDTVRARQHFTQAFEAVLIEASAANPFWQHRIGYMYNEGLGVEQEYAQAIDWYQRAASHGYAPAQLSLGYSYHFGEGVETDYHKAMEWYRKAADQQYASAINNIGVLYREGLGVPKDIQQAIDLYQKAAGLGSATAADNLGDLFRSGEEVGRDYTQAIKWYEQAAGLGHSGAANTLGIMYENGEGVPEGYARAEHWYQQAAEQGNMYGWYNLGNLYGYGKGRDHNWTLAAKHYEKAAGLGHSTATRYLGEMYYFGAGGMVLNSGAAVPNLLESYSGRLNTIIKACMDKKYTKRPSAKQLMKWSKTFFSDQFWPELDQGLDEEPVMPGSNSKRSTHKIANLTIETDHADKRKEAIRDGKKKRSYLRFRSGGNSKKVLVVSALIPLIAVASYYIVPDLEGIDMDRTQGQETTDPPSVTGDSVMAIEEINQLTSEILQESKRERKEENSALKQSFPPKSTISMETIREARLIFSDEDVFYSDGEYKGTFESGYNKRVPDFNWDNFIIAFNFIVNKNRDQWVFVLGHGWRLIGFYLKEDGTIELTINNQRHYFDTSGHYNVGQWRSVYIHFNRGEARVILDEQEIGRYNFSLTPGFPKSDYTITSTNYSNGTTFKGSLRKIKVYDGDG